MILKYKYIKYRINLWSFIIEDLSTKYQFLKKLLNIYLYRFDIIVIYEMWSNEIIYKIFEVFKNFIILNLNILIPICKVRHVNI